MGKVILVISNPSAGPFCADCLKSGRKGQRVPVVSTPLLLSALCPLVWIAKASIIVRHILWTYPGIYPGMTYITRFWYPGICPNLTNTTRFGKRA